MVRMVCLANSIRHDRRCVAGIDMDTGEWIRPVPPSGGGIPNDRVFFGTHLLQVLDVVELAVNPPLLNTKFQRENCVMPKWDWKVVGKVTASQVLPYCENTSPILFTGDDRVSPAQLGQLQPDQWKSLQLVRPKKVEFGRDYWKQSRWRAEFQDSAGNVYRLKVTDPVICNRMGKNEEIKPDCLLTVSLVEPWAPRDGLKPELCYKLVAAVIEL